MENKEQFFCPYCLAKRKLWGEHSSPIKCAFNWEKSSFSSDNWNCWLLDILREEAEQNYTYNDDMYGSVIAMSDHPKVEFVYLEWYKSRGTTDKLVDMNTLKPLKYKFALEFAKQLEENNSGK